MGDAKATHSSARQAMGGGVRGAAVADSAGAIFVRSKGAKKGAEVGAAVRAWLTGCADE